MNLLRTDKKGCLPNFLIAGATRSGTTTLHYYLNQHPDIFLPVTKELSFFDHDCNYSSGLSTYRRYFSGWRGETAIGEASPMYWVHGMLRDRKDRHRYCSYDDAGSRLAAALPQVKTIISLRNPVLRAYSQYWRNRWKGRERASTFIDALAEEQRGRRDPRTHRGCWIYHNRYALHMRRWYELFPPHQVKVLIFEEWTRNPDTYVRELLRYLKVDSRFCLSRHTAANSGWRPRSKWWAQQVSPRLATIPVVRRLDRLNRAYGYAELSSSDYAQAREIFSDEIADLEKLLDRELAPMWPAGG